MSTYCKFCDRPVKDMKEHIYRGCLQSHYCRVLRCSLCGHKYGTCTYGGGSICYECRAEGKVDPKPSMWEQVKGYRTNSLIVDDAWHARLQPPEYYI